MKYRIIALLLICFAVRLSFAISPLPYLFSKGPVIDDAFYSLNVARNVAKGNGFTADGVNRTNGFQPLWVMIAIPVYKVMPEDKVQPLRVMLIIAALIGALSGIFIYRIVARVGSGRAGVISLALWTFSPIIVREGMNGLETGLAGLLMLASLDYYLNHKDGGDREYLITGILLGLGTLARIDMLALAGSIFLISIFSGKRDEIFRKIMFLMIPIAFFIGLWVIFNLTMFGRILPESGSATRNISAYIAGVSSPAEVGLGYYWSNLRDMATILFSQPLFHPVMTLTYVLHKLRFAIAGFGWPYNPNSLYLIFCLPCGILIAWLIRKYPPPKGTGTVAAILGLMSAALIALYVGYAFGPWWYERYAFSMQASAVILGGLMIEGILRKTGIRVWILLVVLFLAVFAHQGWIYFGGKPMARNVYPYWRLAGWMNEKLPRNAVAASFQSGTLSYFAEMPVINLDGVVNGDASRALRERQMWGYLKRQQVNYLADWPWIMDALLFSREPQPPGVALSGPMRFGDFDIYGIEWR